MARLDKQRTTLVLSDDLLREARRKASAEGLSLSQVLRGLLDRWVVGEVRLPVAEEDHRPGLDQALSTHGMWSDRDPDAFLQESRAGLKDRDRELEDAHRLAPR